MTTTRALLLCGVVGPPLFIVTFLIEGATRPGYSWWRNYVSSLATGDGGWVQIANFLVWGTLAIAFSIGVVRTGLVAPGVLIFLYGAGLLVAGVFVTDPSLGYPPGAPAEHTTHGMIHGLAGLGVFTLNAVAAFVVAQHFFRDRGSHAWAICALVARVWLDPVAWGAPRTRSILNGPSVRLRRAPHADSNRVDASPKEGKICLTNRELRTPA